MKTKKLIKCLALTGFIFAMSSCGANEIKEGLLEPSSQQASLAVSVQSVEISPNTITVKPGDFYYLEAKVLPENATNKKVNWKSGSPSIAEVDNDGFVVAKKVGETTITATSEDGAKTGMCKIIVKSVPVRVERVELDTEIVYLDYNNLRETVTVKATVYPSNADNKDIEFKSLDENIATVSSKGTVKGKSLGCTTIQAISVDNPEIKVECHCECSKKISGTTVKNAARAIELKQQEEGFVIPTVVQEIEHRDVKLTKNGVLQNQMIEETEMLASKKDGLFLIRGEDKNILVEGGMPTLESYAWIGYTNKNLQTYLFHEKGTMIKNYMRIDSTSFVGRPNARFEATREIFNNLFRNGETFVNELLEAPTNAKGLAWLQSQTLNDNCRTYATDITTDPTHLRGGFGARYENEIAGIDEENENNIPYGTPYTLYVFRDYDFVDYYCDSETINQGMEWEIGTDKFVQDWLIEYNYKFKDVEVKIPDVKDYAEVNSIGDL